MIIVFLDIDGVLNSEVYLRQLEGRQPRPTSIAQLIDPDTIVRLNRLVAVTHAKIVISSSWRKLFDPPELHRILRGYGLLAEIIGETPDGYNDPELLAAFGYIDRIFRGHEIDGWLKKHPEVTKFVILDDCSDMEMHKGRLVQTDPDVGLSDDDVTLAINMLEVAPCHGCSHTYHEHPNDSGCQFWHSRSE